MALYNNGSYLKQAAPGPVAAEFNKVFKPGDQTTWSGIYRCVNCGHEVVHTHDRPLPPQNSHVHRTLLPIRWQLVVTDLAGAA